MEEKAKKETKKAAVAVKPAEETAKEDSRAEAVDVKKLTLQQKLRKIGEMAAALQKTKEGYGYKYVPESDVLNVVSAGLNKYGLNCVPSIRPETVKVERFSYTKIKNGKEIPISETMVTGSIDYTFYDIYSGESLLVPWTFVANMEDGAQAFGSALTYANRYFFCKFFQIATVEDDPDEYRKKQKENENYEERKQLDEIKSEIIKNASFALSKGVDRSAIYDGIKKLNGGNQNPSSITDIKVGESIMKLIDELVAKTDKEAVHMPAKQEKKQEENADKAE